MESGSWPVLTTIRYDAIWLVELLFLAVFWLDHGVRLAYTQPSNFDVRLFATPSMELSLWLNAVKSVEKL